MGFRPMNLESDSDQYASTNLVPARKFISAKILASEFKKLLGSHMISVLVTLFFKFCIPEN